MLASIRFFSNNVLLFSDLRPVGAGIVQCFLINNLQTSGFLHAFVGEPPDGCVAGGERGHCKKMTPKVMHDIDLESAKVSEIKHYLTHLFSGIIFCLAGVILRDCIDNSAVAWMSFYRSDVTFVVVEIARPTLYWAGLAFIIFLFIKNRNRTGGK